MRCWLSAAGVQDGELGLSPRSFIARLGLRARWRAQRSGARKQTAVSQSKQKSRGGRGAIEKGCASVPPESAMRDR